MKIDRHPARRKGGGRPPKFAEPSQPVTLTLPASTLRDLQHIDPDRGHAIVKVTKRALQGGGAPRPLVEIVEMAPNKGLLVIGPSHALRRIPFLHLLEVAPGRFLLALDPGHDFKSLEIAVNDILDGPEREETELELFKQLLEQVRKLRKTGRVSMANILFVNLDAKRQR